MGKGYSESHISDENKKFLFYFVSILFIYLFFSSMNPLLGMKASFDIVKLNTLLCFYFSLSVRTLFVIKIFIKTKH